jgi:hypothetical protein
VVNSEAVDSIQYNICIKLHYCDYSSLLTGSYPKPDKSIQHSYNLFLLRHILLLSRNLCLGLPSSIVFRYFEQNFV